MKIEEEDFHFLTNIIKRFSGISLGDDKMYLLESRFLPLIRKHQFNCYRDLVNAIKTSHEDVLIHEVIESITTNETSFFRDLKPFSTLKNEIIPKLVNSPSSTIRIWSAACSTGQEPYSIAITLKENNDLLSGKNFEIIATDIDEHILQKAINGVYTQFDVQRGLPVSTLIKYFEQNDDNWIIKEEIRSLVNFQPLNLIENFTNNINGYFDIIFCRNVLIYFDEKTKKAVLEKIAQLMKPHSALFLGSAENPTHYTDKFSHFGNNTGVYRIS